jgi:starch-binding outer membrane protein, SusD/RagB family
MKNIYIFIFIVAFFGSCSKELDQQPISAASTETFYKTPNDFIQGVNAIYADLAGYPDRLFNLSETRSDNMYGVSDGGVRDWEGINSFWNTISSNPYIPEAWNSNFNGIQRANTVIDKLKTNGDIVTDPALRNRLKAEAKFLRAFYYFDLVRWFGKVPVIDHTVTNDEALKTHRSPVSDVYTLIISDLAYAADSLLVTYAAADKGRVTKYAAKSLLALVYMTRSGPTYDIEGPGLGLNEWGQALSLLNEVIGSGQYSFLPTFKEIFRYNNEYNKDVVFDINFLSGQTPILGSHFPATLVPENWFVSKAKPTMGGSDRPLSSDLLSKFAANDGRKPHTIHGKYTYPTNKVDTASFYIKYLDSTAVPATMALRFDWPINFIVIRYTDVLMLKAECILHGAAGTQTDVDGIVNQVRTRAGLTGLTNVTLAQLMNERRLEFAAEGLRWHDLVRSGLITTVIPAWIAKEDSKRNQIHAFQKEFVIYPIPQAEMDVKVGLYTQNAGYN